MVRLYGWYLAAAATCMSLLSSSDAISSAVLPAANPEPADGGVASIPSLAVLLQPALVENAPTPVGASVADNALASGTATAPIPSLVVILKPWPGDRTSAFDRQSSITPATQAPTLATPIPPNESSDDGSDTGSGLGQYEDDTYDELSSRNAGPATSPIPTLIVLLKPWPGDQSSASDGHGALVPATQAPPLPTPTPQPTTEKPTPMPTTNKPTPAPTPAQPQHDDPVLPDDSSDDGSDEGLGSGSGLYYDGNDDNDDNDQPTSAPTTTAPTPAPATEKPTPVPTTNKPTPAPTTAHPKHEDPIVPDDSSDDGSGYGSSSSQNATGGYNEPPSGTEKPISAPVPTAPSPKPTTEKPTTPVPTPTQHQPVVPDDSSDDSSASSGSESTEEPASKPPAPTINVATRTRTPAGTTSQPDFDKPAASNVSSGDGSGLDHDLNGSTDTPSSVTPTPTTTMLFDDHIDEPVPETPITTTEPATPKPTPTRAKRTRRPRPAPTTAEPDGEDPIFLPIYVETSGSGSDTGPDEPWIVKVPKHPATEEPVEDDGDDEWDDGDDDGDDADDPPRAFIHRRLRAAFH